MSNSTGLCTRGLVVFYVLMIASTLYAAAGDKAKITGMITERTGDTMIVKTKDGNTTVVLDDKTKVQRPDTVSFAKISMSAAVLIPGLKVTAAGVNDEQNRLLATSISFKNQDLETAEMIQAGLHPTAEQVAANLKQISANQQNVQASKQDIAKTRRELAQSQQDIAANKQTVDQNIKDIEDVNDRFSTLSEYDQKRQLTLNFAVGSAHISDQDSQQLAALAQEAQNYRGYLIEVKGFADASGNATMNQQLSEDRASAVIAYLIQNAKIPIRHIVAPGAMGIAQPVASNETAAGRAENRRVEVTVLVNRGLSAKP